MEQSLSGKSVTIVGAGPVGLGIARESIQAGAKNVQVIARDIPVDENSARKITGGCAAGYGAPFATKNELLLEWAAASLGHWMTLARDRSHLGIRQITARTVTTDDATIKFLTGRQEFLRGPNEIGVENCYELSAFSFNPSGLLIDWAKELKDSGCKFIKQEVALENFEAAFSDGVNPFRTDVAVLTLGAGDTTKVQPVRGVLGHIKNVQLGDIQDIQTSAMFEDDLSKLVYLTPRPGRGEEWDLIIGGTFQIGEGTCTDKYAREVIRDRLVSARKLFGGVVPHLIQHLDKPIDEYTVGYRPRAIDGAPITEHRRSGPYDVFRFNGMSGQGWVTLPARSKHAVEFMANTVARPRVL